MASGEAVYPPGIGNSEYLDIAYCVEICSSIGLSLRQDVQEIVGDGLPVHLVTVCLCIFNIAFEIQLWVQRYLEASKREIWNSFPLNRILMLRLINCISFFQ
ncbi:unnamed protein product [Blepharisma stoltei]|uniref:Uncharacterized protein n=1 Tax=Blepharisma stoltei TaxID=1481888 RepID=A0AAU9J5K1_9CILI|nr:unnamed protein product [Blepharisma stoltei]